MDGGWWKTSGGYLRREVVSLSRSCIFIKLILFYINNLLFTSTTSQTRSTSVVELPVRTFGALSHPFNYTTIIDHCYGQYLTPSPTTRTKAYGEKSVKLEKWVFKSNLDMTPSEIQKSKINFEIYKIDKFWFFIKSSKCVKTDSEVPCFSC